jgi:hypothetical protein
MAYHMDSFTLFFLFYVHVCVYIYVYVCIKLSTVRSMKAETQQGTAL